MGMICRLNPEIEDPKLRLEGNRRRFGEVGRN